jgi:hypothetical protein
MACFALLLRAAERPSAAAEPVALALEGIWVHVGTPARVHPVPESGGRLKFRINGHWTYTHADPATGEVKEHFGGIYRVQGDEYAETIDYSADPDDPELRSTLKFKVKIEGDVMTQTGVGNPYTEVWKRVR